MIHVSNTLDLPTDVALATGLSSLFASRRSAGVQIALLNREPNIYASTFASEVVTCRDSDGSVLKLLCKYGANTENHAFGHRGGVTYEAQIYRDVLSGQPNLAPKLYGTFVNEPRGDTCLILEYLVGAKRLNCAANPSDAVVRAARRLGTLHATTEGWARFPAINVYSRDYYSGWARRTLQFARGFEHLYPWLETVCEGYQGLVGAILEVPAVVVHGESYPMNILVDDSAVFFIDWETAALGLGEIDLAALSEGWEARVVAACEREYCAARWPQAAPSNFDHRLLFARLYWSFRWLGDRPVWTAKAANESARENFSQLRTLGERLGIL